MSSVWKSGKGRVSNPTKIYEIGAAPVNRMAAIGLGRTKEEQPSPPRNRKTAIKRKELKNIGILSIGAEAYYLIQDEIKKHEPSH